MFPPGTVMFESARKEWQMDKKTLEHAIIDMTAAEKNPVKNRFSHKSDMLDHKEQVRVDT